MTPAPVPIQTPAAQEKVRRNCTTNTQLVKHTLNKHKSHNHQKFSNKTFDHPEQRLVAADNLGRNILGVHLTALALAKKGENKLG